MMTRKSKLNARKFILAFVLIFLVPQNFLAASDWVVAAQKFELTGKQTDAVSQVLTTAVPARILDSLGSNNFRTILKSEQYERELYELKKNQNSLFLQLSSELKKRDSLVLTSYSKKELDKKILEENQKIEKIQEDLQENLESRKELEEKIYSSDSDERFVQTESKDEYADFLKSFFSTSTAEDLLVEKIAFYRNDSAAVYSPSDYALEKGFLSPEFESEIVKASIRALLTGKITIYGDYISVAVEVFGYPNAKRLAAVTEVGTIDDLDFICSSIANQLVPPLSNSLPVSVCFELSPKNANLYIDDLLIKELPEFITLDSGVHSVFLEADGFKSAGTNYYFTGNNIYKMEISLLENTPSKIDLVLPNVSDGSLYANGYLYEAGIDGVSGIKVNGENILAQFVREDKSNAFIYVGKNYAVDMNILSANVNFIDRNEYIEKRRKWMYTSYSALITSLIPLFYTQGVYNSYKNAAAVAVLDDNATKKANAWTLASNICSGISAGLGGWFLYELFRYLKSADLVLPYEANTYKGNLVVKEKPNLEPQADLNAENQEEIEEKTE